MFDKKWCKPKCRFSQVINRSKFDPQGMIRHNRIIEKKKKIRICFWFPLESGAKKHNLN
jgi:hypothetical protein